MRTRILVGVSVAVMMACAVFVRSASANTVFRVECVAPGNNDLFVLDPQTISLPEERDHFSFYIDLCVSEGGHPRVQGNFFTR
jgi:hypothetical protein